MHVGHVIPHLGSAFGGAVHMLATLADLQFRQGVRVTVLATPLATDGPAVELPAGVRVVAPPARAAIGFRYCPELARWLADHGSELDLIHSHLLWTDCHRLAARTARQHGVPHVISVCGTLGAGALRHRGLKKWPVAHWFQNRGLREASCLNAKSALEVTTLRDYGLLNPIALIPNVVDSPAPASEDAIDGYRERHGLDRDVRRVLFLGRIHPIKGLERLIRAWKPTVSRHDGWELILAGPDDRGYRARMEQLTESLGLQRSVRFTGQLSSDEKWLAVQEAALFVLPSDSENFGSAAVEAMAMGTPVIATEGTPWAELREAGAGWWVEARPEAVAEALDQALSLGDERRREMGRTSRSIAERYTPEAAQRAWSELYDWIIGGGSRPDCVELAGPVRAA